MDGVRPVAFRTETASVHLRWHAAVPEAVSLEFGQRVSARKLA